MISPVQSKLDSFKGLVNTPLENLAESTFWRKCLTLIREGGVIENKGFLGKKACKLQQDYENPSISHIFRATLKLGMESVLKKAEESLATQEFFMAMLSQVFRLDDQAKGLFIDGFKKHLADEESSPSKALSFMLSRSMIEDQEFERDPRLSRYICPIRGDLITSQPVYCTSQVDSQEVPCQLYHKSELTKAVRQKGQDPCTRKEKTLADIKEYAPGDKVVDRILGELRYPKAFSEKEVQNLALPPRSFFLAASLAYSMARDEYEKREGSQGFNEAAQKAEKTIQLSIDLFEPYLRNIEEKDVAAFEWTSGKLKREESFTYAQRMLSFPSQEEGKSKNSFDLEMDFMKAFLEFHQESEMSLEDLKSTFESELPSYLELCKESKQELELDSIEEDFFQKLTAKILEKQAVNLEELFKEVKKALKREYGAGGSQSSQEGPFKKMKEAFQE